MKKKAVQSGPVQGSTILRTDTCVSPFQDGTHGRNVRVHNVGKGKLRCTVCSREVLT